MIGIEALAMFAREFQADELDVSISVEMASDETAVAEFNVNRFNRLVQYSELISRVENLTVSANGSGCFMIQVNTQPSS